MAKSQSLIIFYPQNIGLQAKILSERTFTIFVVMALVRPVPMSAEQPCAIIDRQENRSRPCRLPP